MTITICGENTFAAQQALKELVTAFTKKYGPHAVERLDGTVVTPAILREQIQAISLFASQRLVILKYASANRDLFSILPDILSQVAEGITLAIVEAVLDKRTKTYKALKATTDFREYSFLSDAALQKWIVHTVADQNGHITAKAAYHLITLIGNDQWQLSNEITKLISFSPEVSEAVINKLVTPNLEVSAFALLDAAFAGRQTEVRQLLNEMKDRSDPYEFFGLLVWQLQVFALIAVAPPMPAAELGKQTGIKPFVLQKSGCLAKQLGLPKIKEISHDIAVLDMQLKSSGVSPWILVEQAIYKMAVKPGV